MCTLYCYICMKKYINMSYIPNIFLVGEVSSGKSSFLNALASGFISCVSLQRETFEPSYYNFRETGTEDSLNKISKSLEEIHKDNQVQRENLISNNNEVHVKKSNSEPYIIPTRYGFKNINIIDFPGLNDSEDKNDTFIKILEEHIHEAHAIFFLTSAEKAFTNASELDTYNKIKKCIETEFYKSYHYIELIIIVNKYDDTNDIDIYQIYNRITKKINTDEIFRISSHKLFVQSVIDRKGCIYIPKFLKTEAIKIFKNSNVSMYGLADKFNKKIENWTIQHSFLKINYIDISDSDESCTTDDMINCKIIGDWDNLFQYIEDFHSKYAIKQMKKFELIIANVCGNISKLYYDSNAYDETIKRFNGPFIEPLIFSVSIIEKVIIQMKIFNIEINDILSILMAMINKILNNSIQNSKSNTQLRYLIIEILFGIIKNINFRKSILECITNDIIINRISYITILSLMLKIDIEMLWNMPNGRKLIFKLLTNPIIYSDYIPFSSANPCCYYENNNIITKYFHKYPSVINNDSWFISLLLLRNSVPPELKYAIVISKTGILTLRQLYINNKINKKYLDSCQKDLSMILQTFLHSIINDNQCLEHKLFTLKNDPQTLSSYNNYIKTEAILDEITNST